MVLFTRKFPESKKFLEITNPWFSKIPQLFPDFQKFPDFPEFQKKNSPTIPWISKILWLFPDFKNSPTIPGHPGSRWSCLNKCLNRSQRERHLTKNSSRRSVVLLRRQQATSWKNDRNHMGTTKAATTQRREIIPNRTNRKQTNREKSGCT
jgi:hypothetical protein